MASRWKTYEETVAWMERQAYRQRRTLSTAWEYLTPPSSTSKEKMRYRPPTGRTWRQLDEDMKVDDAERRLSVG